MKQRIVFILSIILACFQLGSLNAETGPELIKKTGIKGGLIVHLNCKQGKLTADLAKEKQYLVHGLDIDDVNIKKARNYIRSKKKYGRVSVSKYNGKKLPFADNLVNLIIDEYPGKVPLEEMIRVLVPNGILYIRKNNKWEKTVKPRPKDIDEWTHFLHGPDNNAVAEDTVVGVPRHVQWIGDPKFARSHEQLASLSAMVSTKGRLFYIIDKGQTADIRMPARWWLVARDAFNGVVLWTRKVNNWSDHLHGFRTGPPDLAFRLVAVDDRIYVSLDQNKPVVALDASTGEILSKYKGTENVRQIICTGNHLVILSGTSQVDIHRKPRENKSAKRIITAFHPGTGAMLWRKEINKDALLPIVVSRNSLMFQTTGNLVCLELNSGKEQWQIDHHLTLTELNLLILIQAT